MTEEELVRCDGGLVAAHSDKCCARCLVICTNSQKLYCSDTFQNTCVCVCDG